MEQTFISIITFIILITISIYLIKCTLAFLKKRKFSKLYNIGKLPKSIKVRNRTTAKGINYYYLNYPYWSVSKKDGTADKRIKGNYIIWQKSNLYVDNYTVLSKKPYDLIDVVRRLRSQGIKIDLCEEEKKKRANLLKKKEAFAHNNDIQKIINYYSEKPTDFEKLCADLFESLGYTTKLTPATNDGGYDILLNKKTEKTIVECKCYSIKHKIGRPNIQKLVGANEIILADKMIFITTSDFSIAANSYAEKVGVELINGDKLINLLNMQGFISRQKVKINDIECQLNSSDLYPYIPNDIYEQFFY